MKEYPMIFILLLTWNLCLSQDRDHFEKYGLYFNHNCEIEYSNQTRIGEKSFVFGRNVNVRTDSSINSLIVETLDEGESIEILYSTENYGNRIKEHGEPWLKIKTSTGKIGFVYGALITKNYLNYDLNKNGIKELILLGNDYLNAPNASVKIIENDELVTEKKIESLCIDAHCESLAMLRILKDEKLLNKEVIEVGTGSNYCRASWISNFLIFEENELKLLFTTELGYQKNTEVLFPSDEGGLENKILIEKVVYAANSPKLICFARRTFLLEDGLMKDLGFRSDMKDELVRINLEIGDTLRTSQFNIRGNKTIKKSKLEKIIGVDHGIFVIDESSNAFLLGDYSNEGESVTIYVLLLNKQNYTITKTEKVAYETAWENGYQDMFSIYKGRLGLDVIYRKGYKDYENNMEWNRDTIFSYFRID